MTIAVPFKRFLGDKALAAEHLGLARSLMQRTRAYLGALDGGKTWTLANGAIIRTQVAGGLEIITVDVRNVGGGGCAPVAVQSLTGFVIWPASTGYGQIPGEEGIKQAFITLASSDQSGGAGYRVWYYSPTQYELNVFFPASRPVGFINTRVADTCGNLTEWYPAEGAFYGNQTWIGPNSEILSWNGSSNRYFAEGTRNRARGAINARGLATLSQNKVVGGFGNVTGIGYKGRRIVRRPGTEIENEEFPQFEVVTGACLHTAQNGTTYLIWAGRDGNDEFLYRVKLVRSRLSGLLYMDGDITELSVSLPSGEGSVWAFNASGTRAVATRETGGFLRKFYLNIGPTSLDDPSPDAQLEQASSGNDEVAWYVGSKTRSFSSAVGNARAAPPEGWPDTPGRADHFGRSYGDFDTLYSCTGVSYADDGTQASFQRFYDFRGDEEVSGLLEITKTYSRAWNGTWEIVGTFETPGGEGEPPNVLDDELLQITQTRTASQTIKLTLDGVDVINDGSGNSFSRTETYVTQSSLPDAQAYGLPNSVFTATANRVSHLDLRTKSVVVERRQLDFELLSTSPSVLGLSSVSTSEQRIVTSTLRLVVDGENRGQWSDAPRTWTYSGGESASFVTGSVQPSQSYAIPPGGIGPAVYDIGRGELSLLGVTTVLDEGISYGPDVFDLSGPISNERLLELSEQRLLTSDTDLACRELNNNGQLSLFSQAQGAVVGDANTVWQPDTLFDEGASLARYNLATFRRSNGQVEHLFDYPFPMYAARVNDTWDSLGRPRVRSFSVVPITQVNVIPGSAPDFAPLSVI